MFFTHLTSNKLKKIILVALSGITFSAQTQEPIKVGISPSTTTVSSNPTYSVDIPQVTMKDVKKDWLSYTSKSSKGKATIENGEFVQQSAVNKNISPNPFFLYSNLTETTAGVRLNARIGFNDLHQSSNITDSTQRLAFQKYLHDFAVSEYKEVVTVQLKKEEHKLKDMEKDLAKLIKGGEKSIKTINSNDRSNERADDAIAINKKDIETSSDKITEQKTLVEITAEDPNAKKGAEKTLGNMEDDKKDLQKENESAAKKIDDRNKENRKEDRNLVNANQSYESQVLAIEKQKALVNVIKEKLDHIF
jgi:hypothetical protein